MAEYIGSIEIPDPGASGTFPLVPDAGIVFVSEPSVVVHPFGHGEAQVEQRFYLGPGVRKITIQFGRLTPADRSSLLNFFALRRGSYQPFTLNITMPDGSTSAYTVRFPASIALESFESLMWRGSIELIEVPATSPTYSVSLTTERFPAAALKSALLSQVQECIPLLKIGSDVFLSDRRVTVGGQLYQPRLVDWSGISQSIDGSADQARFTLGNADRVFSSLVNAVDIWKQPVEFAIFHAGTATKLNLWKGYVANWSMDQTGAFSLEASDVMVDLKLAYPSRKITRQDGFTVPEQPVNVGGKKGISRITATSVANDTAYGKPLKDVYVNNAAAPLPVDCEVICGRDESEFAAALGVVGRGPIGAYSSGDTRFMHTLDGQTHHGGGFSGTGLYGLRRSLGGNPATGSEALTDNAPDQGSNWFALDSTSTSWPQTAQGPTGAAFLQIRRVDEKGVQPLRASERKMQSWVAVGLGCYVWSGPGARTWQSGCTNPVWVAVNVMLRARGLQGASAATQEAWFDVAAAVAAATTCSATVEKLIGEGAEEQFRFVGVIADERPLRDWLAEILSCCLGYATHVFGRLKIGIRQNSSAVEAFTIGNILQDSLQLASFAPECNDLSIAFADEDYQYQQNTVNLVDTDSVARVGPLKANVNSVGIPTKSQAARVLTVKLRESMGGLTAEEQMAARMVAFKTTVLALNTEPGMVCSMTHPDMPNGSGEFRVTSWRLNSDWSIDIAGATTTDSMYDLTIGEKPVDVVPDPVPARAWYPIELGSEAAAPQPPTGVTLTVTDSGNRFGLRTTWTPPAAPGGTTAYQIQARYYLDAEATTPESLWIDLATEIGVATAANESGYWVKPEGERWAQSRVRGINSDDVATDWVTSGIASVGGTDTPRDVVPQAPTAVTGSIVEHEGTYGITTTWTPPTDASAVVAYDVEAKFYTDAGGTSADSEWVPLGSTDYTSASLVSGMWPRPTDVARWVRRRVRSKNAFGTTSEWVESAGLLKVDVMAAPAAPASGAVVVGASTRGGVAAFNFSITINPAALPGTAEGYLVEARYYSDAAATIPDSDWIPLGWVDPASLTLSTDYWPRPTEPRWARLRFAAQNANNTISAWVESGIVAISGGELDLREAAEATFGPGLRKDQLGRPSITATGLLLNGDFEFGLDEWNAGSQWETSASDAVSGALCAKCSANAEDQYLVQSKLVAAGQAFTLEAMARTTTNGGAGSTFVFLNAFNSSGSYIGGTSVNITGDTWGLYRASYELPAGASRLDVGVVVGSANSAGRLLVDQIKLLPLEKLTGADLERVNGILGLAGGSLSQESKYGSNARPVIIGSGAPSNSDGRPNGAYYIDSLNNSKIYKKKAGSWTGIEVGDVVAGAFVGFTLTLNLNSVTTTVNNSNDTDWPGGQYPGLVTKNNASGEYGFVGYGTIGINISGNAYYSYINRTQHGIGYRYSGYGYPRVIIDAGASATGLQAFAPGASPSAVLRAVVAGTDNYGYCNMVGGAYGAGYYVDGVKVVGARGSSISRYDNEVTDIVNYTYDTSTANALLNLKIGYNNLRWVVSSVIARMQAHGLIS